MPYIREMNLQGQKSALHPGGMYIWLSSRKKSDRKDSGSFCAVSWNKEKRSACLI